MTIYVALLRGINVGGRSKLAMADLRAMASDCGFTDVATYIQSGNVVLRSADSATDVAASLRSAIAAAGGVDPAIAMRTRAQLSTVIDANPYVGRSDDETQLHVTFAVEGARFTEPALDPDAFAPEAFTVRSREAYLYLPNGMGRSKLAVELAKVRPQDGTTRNWRTTKRLLAMADELA